MRPSMGIASVICCRTEAAQHREKARRNIAVIAMLEQEECRLRLCVLLYRAFSFHCLLHCSIDKSVYGFTMSLSVGFDYFFLSLWHSQVSTAHADTAEVDQAGGDQNV